jgi:hypothetical protein
LRGLLCCLVTGFLCAMIISVREGLRHLKCLSLWLPSLMGLGARVFEQDFRCDRRNA